MSASKRDRAIAAATRRLFEAERYLIAALEHDDKLGATDRIGLDLARATDMVSAAVRTARAGQEHARLRRRDMNRLMAEEVQR